MDFEVSEVIDESVQSVSLDNLAKEIFVLMSLFWSAEKRARENEFNLKTKLESS